jgi:tetratricopeptide (TPR) repeat protein
MAFLLEKAVRRVSIVPDSESKGHVRGTWYPSFRPDIYDISDRRTRSIAEREITVTLAGPVAEAKFTGRSTYLGRGSDRQFVVDIALRMCDEEKEASKYVEWLLQRTKNLIGYRINWVQVEALARELMDHRKLSGKEAKEICFKSKRAATFHNRGDVRSANKEYGKAIDDYDEALRSYPEFPLAYNNRAWIWATCPDAQYRDGNRAVESATRASELTEWKVGRYLGTLAAACAESGDFDAAVKWQAEALKLYQDENDRRTGRERLKLYKAKQPYHEETEQRAPYTRDRSLNALVPQPSQHRGQEPFDSLADPRIDALAVARDVEDLDRVLAKPAGDV